VGERKFIVLVSKKLAKNIAKGRLKEITAPSNFSLYLNPNETLKYIEDVRKAVRSGMPVRIAMERIELLSIDTIMYFLATIKRIKLTGLSFSFIGSLPKNKECKHLIQVSGFLNFVKSKNIRQDLTHETNVVKIICGQHVEGKTAKKICKFVISKLNLTRLDTFNLYDMIMELMSNTREHAYVNGPKFITDWYLFVYYIPEKEAVRFIFLDTGAGIPSTIRKRLLEPTKTALGLNSHTDYIKSALAGTETYIRSRTGESYRGNGLPTINSFSQQNYIKNLTIISDRGYFMEAKEGDMDLGLEGTLFYWEISRGGHNE
jgi:hypothetical protein